MSLVRILYDNDFDSFFDDSIFPVIQRKRAKVSPNTDIKPFHPRIDIHEDKEKNLITTTFELPGMKKEDVSIHVQHDQLTVSGQMNASTENKEGDYTVRERSYGKFTRSVKLPDGVKSDDINAKMENGVLSVTFPATQPEHAPSMIEIVVL